MSVSSTVTLIAGKTVKYIHLCMLMYVEVNFGTSADICGLLVYVHFTDCFVFISCFHRFVHKTDLSLMLTLMLLIIKMACFLNIK